MRTSWTLVLSFGLTLALTGCETPPSGATSGELGIVQIQATPLASDMSTSDRTRLIQRLLQPETLVYFRVGQQTWRQSDYARWPEEKAKPWINALNGPGVPQHAAVSNAPRPGFYFSLTAYTHTPVPLHRVELDAFYLDRDRKLRMLAALSAQMSSDCLNQAWVLRQLSESLLLVMQDYLSEGAAAPINYEVSLDWGDTPALTRQHCVTPPAPDAALSWPRR